MRILTNLFIILRHCISIRFIITMPIHKVRTQLVCTSVSPNRRPHGSLRRRTRRRSGRVPRDRLHLLVVLHDRILGRASWFATARPNRRPSRSDRSGFVFFSFCVFHSPERRLTGWRHFLALGCPRVSAPTRTTRSRGAILPTLSAGSTAIGAGSWTDRRVLDPRIGACLIAPGFPG